MTDRLTRRAQRCLTPLRLVIVVQSEMLVGVKKGIDLDKELAHTHTGSVPL